MFRRLGLEGLVRLLALIVVGGIGAAVGFVHTHSWALHHGQYGLVAWGDAVVIECAAVVAGLELRRSPGVFPGAVLVVAFLLQMTAQVSEAEPTAAGWVVAATPALAFLIVVKLAMRGTRSTKPQTLHVLQSVSADRVGQSPPVSDPVGVGELLPAQEEMSNQENRRPVWPPAA